MKTNHDLLRKRTVAQLNSFTGSLGSLLSFLPMCTETTSGRENAL